MKTVKRVADRGNRTARALRTLKCRLGLAYFASRNWALTRANRMQTRVHSDKQ